MHTHAPLTYNNYYITFLLWFIAVIAGVGVNIPTIRDADQHMYIREWSGGILAGCFELDGRPCFQDGVPQSFEFQLLPEDWDHIRKNS